MPIQQVTLETLACGTAGELFGRALEAVLANIDDANTDAKAARKIILTVTLKPKQDRSSADVFVAVKTSLAGVEPVETTVFLSRDRNRLVAIENNPRQEELPFTAPSLAVAEGGANGLNS